MPAIEFVRWISMPSIWALSICGAIVVATRRASLDGPFNKVGLPAAMSDVIKRCQA